MPKKTMTFPMTRQGVRDLDQVKAKVLPISGGPAHSPSSQVNVGTTERWLSTIGGAALVLTGLVRRTLPGLGLALAGVPLLYRGLTGHCPVYRSLGTGTAQQSTQSNAEVVYTAR